MSLGSMAAELQGIVTQMPIDYAKTIVKRSWSDVQRKNLWSFLMFERNWTSPSLLNAGLATVTQGSNQVTFNSAAKTAINAIGLFPSSVIQRQFRVGIGTIYNIWAWDATSGTATLDRNYQESSAPSGTAYQIYQCYYPAPVKDWWQWLSIKEMTNYNDLIFTQSRAWLDERDPQRTIYYLPTHVVPYTTDLNPASSTYQYQLFELWGQPVNQLTYQLFGLRKSRTLDTNAAEIQPEVGEDCVMALATYYGYQWAEANWKREWGPKPSFMGLMRELVSNNSRGVQAGLYNRLFREYRMQDRSRVDNFMTRLRRTGNILDPNGWYSSLTNSANPGAPW